MSSSASITVLLPGSAESWAAFLERMGGTSGEMLIILSGRDEELESQDDVRRQFLKSCTIFRDRLRIATKQQRLSTEARERGFRVLDRTRHVRLFLADHPQLPEALRAFSPHLWQQQLKTRLQRMGLLSVPKLRIGLLVGLSFLLFLFVLFRLLPSADISIKSRQEPVSQTINILLVQSGAVVEGFHRVRTMPLVPLIVHLERELTSNAISKEFIGTSAHVVMTVVNASTQPYSLRKGTRVTNQAGMIFRLQDQVVNLAPGGQATVPAKAEDQDLYGEIIGERGNIPAGLKWEIPGLSPEERKVIYAENKLPAAGGTTAYRSVLRKEDLELARQRLEQQMVAGAKELIEEERVKRNAQDPHRQLSILSYPELTRAYFSGASLPTELLGQQVSSFTIAEKLSYRVSAYDASAIVDFLSGELRAHVREGKELMEDSLSRDRLDVRVIGYDDDLAWVKLTVELVGKDRYILDTLTPAGALFAKRMREKVAGLSRDEALRIVKNMPEIEDAKISIWPPWQSRMPAIPSNISITTE